MSGRLHRNHLRTASPFSAEVGERGTVIIQNGKESKLNIKFYGQEKKNLNGAKELFLPGVKIKMKKEKSSFRFTAQNLM